MIGSNPSTPSLMNYRLGRVIKLYLVSVSSLGSVLQALSYQHTPASLNTDAAYSTTTTTTQSCPSEGVDSRKVIMYEVFFCVATCEIKYPSSI